ncbi:MAG: polysaccharide biosynthesis tyrosine autokinase [Ancrocorticia sp.]|uniref:polysaccharide biosynthesis tyrosine autokinase n=1 Tax=Ancrocorticia sp. TaxID=2593684 RepID=UPI003F913246
MELDEYLLLLRKRWLLILVTTALFTGGALGFSLAQTPRYAATTQLFVSVRTGEASVGDLSEGSSFVQQAVASYVSIVDSAAILDQVIEDLGLDVTRHELAKQVTADSPQDTVLINIHVTDADPQRAVAIADTTSAVLADVIVNNLEQTPEGSPARVHVDVVQPAELPQAPTSPNTVLNLAIGCLAGVLVGVAIAVLTKTLDTRIRSKTDVKAVTPIPVIGTIGTDPEAHARPLIAQLEPRHPVVESYRSMRTNLRFLGASGNQNGAESLVITSSGPNEGKSTLAANLAVLIADTGTRVALVDADLRKPSVATMMGIEGAVGLTDVLIGRASLDEVIQPWGCKGLAVLPAGAIPPNPSELLGGADMHRVIEELGRDYDYVIFDAPPILAVTDAAILSKEARGAIMVAAAGKVRKAELASALESMKAARGHVIGLALTMVPTRGVDARSYGVYGYEFYGDGAFAAPSPELFSGARAQPS